VIPEVTDMNERIDEDDIFDEVIEEHDEVTEEERYVLEEEVLESYASDLEMEKWEEVSNQYGLEKDSGLI
jgi:hypothetical protein